MLSAVRLFNIKVPTENCNAGNSTGQNCCALFPQLISCLFWPFYLLFTKLTSCLFTRLSWEGERYTALRAHPQQYLWACTRSRIHHLQRSVLTNDFYFFLYIILVNTSGGHFLINTRLISKSINRLISGLVCIDRKLIWHDNYVIKITN